MNSSLYFYRELGLDKPSRGNHVASCTTVLDWYEHTGFGFIIPKSCKSESRKGNFLGKWLLHKKFLTAVKKGLDHESCSVLQHKTGFLSLYLNFVDRSSPLRLLPAFRIA